MRARKVAVFGRLIRRVLESHGDSTNDNGQYGLRQPAELQAIPAPMLMTGNDQHG